MAPGLEELDLTANQLGTHPQILGSLGSRWVGTDQSMGAWLFSNHWQAPCASSCLCPFETCHWEPLHSMVRRRELQRIAVPKWPQNWEPIVQGENLEPVLKNLKLPQLERLSSSNTTWVAIST